MRNFETIDIVIFVVYAVLLLGLGWWFSRKTKAESVSTEDYFLAGKSLPFWAIGASLIAANISAEQFIGMSGSGFNIGLAIASYEWMAALTLILVAKWLLPIFLHQKLFTIPQFIEQRFNTSLKTILAVFWLGLFVFVNLTAVLFLGAKALDTIIGSGNGDLIFIFMVGLALFSAAYSIKGGLAAVAWTDVLQVVLLLFGGFLTTYIALQKVTPEGGLIHGFQHLTKVAPEKFHLLFSEKDEHYNALPGWGVLFGGMWVANLYYWGFNQYIIQRALAAKSIHEAQKGLVFAAFIKILLPLLVVIPGIIVFVLYQQNEGTSIIPEIQNSFQLANGNINFDGAYPWLIKAFIPSGLKGLIVAALTAAIVSSLASMLNSTATIFTMDIYEPYFAKGETKNSVKVGKISALVALFIALLIAPMLSSLPELFQYIQEYTGLVSPGILAVFLMGLFVPKTTSKGAIIGVLGSVVMALIFKFVNLIPSLETIQIPFLNQMFYTLILTMFLIYLVSKPANGIRDEKALQLDKSIFKTTNSFNILSLLIIIIVGWIYWYFR
jgi:solute:Na+ symporter, SSS family